MHPQRSIVVLILVCLFFGAALGVASGVALPTAASASELPTLPAVLPGADSPLEDRLVFYDHHQILTQFMGKPCIYGGSTYFYYEMRNLIDASPDAARHRRNALALKVIGLSVAIPALVAVVAMAIARTDTLVMLLVVGIDLAVVFPTTIGQMVELNKSVQSYNTWLREQLVLDPVGQAMGPTGRVGLARVAVGGVRW